MKSFIASALMLLAPALVLAQTPAQPAAKAESKPAAKAAATSSRLTVRERAAAKSAIAVTIASRSVSPAKVAIMGASERMAVRRVARAGTDEIDIGLILFRVWTRLYASAGRPGQNPPSMTSRTRSMRRAGHRFITAYEFFLFVTPDLVSWRE